MESSAAVMRKTGYMLQDESTGREVPEWALVGLLPLRLGDGGPNATGHRGVTIGGVTYEQATGVGSVPHDADARLGVALADDDLLDVTGETSGVWTVVKATKFDQKTARRLPVREVPRPEEWV